MHQFKGGNGYPSLFRKFVHILEIVIGLDLVRFSPTLSSRPLAPSPARSPIHPTPPPPPPFLQFELLHLDCVIRNSDYTVKLFATTLTPLALLVLALLWELGYKLRYGGGRILYNGPAMAYSMIIIYFVLPATSQIIMKSFFCQEFDDGSDVASFMQVSVHANPLQHLKHSLNQWATGLNRVWPIHLLSVSRHQSVIRVSDFCITR